MTNYSIRILRRHLQLTFGFTFTVGSRQNVSLKAWEGFSGFLKKNFPTNYIRGVMSDPPHFIIPRSMIITIQGLENKSAGLPLITRYSPGSDLAVTHWGSSKCGWPCTFRKTRAIKRRSCTAPAPIIFICNNVRTDWELKCLRHLLMHIREKLIIISQSFVVCIGSRNYAIDLSSRDPIALNWNISTNLNCIENYCIYFNNEMDSPTNPNWEWNCALYLESSLSNVKHSWIR